MNRSRIPNYARYGEVSDGDTVDLVYCQPIFSRISEQKWEIRPHRHGNLHQIFLVSEGELDAVLDLRRVTLTGPCVLVVPAGSVHGFGYGDSVRGTMISTSDGFLRGALAVSNVAPWTENIRVIDLHDQREASSRLFELVAAVAEETAHRRQGYLAAVAALMQLIFVHLDRCPAGDGVHSVSSDQLATFERFRELVRRRMRDHLAVAEYCRELGVGERRLNRVCHARTGSSPLAYIHQQLVEEAKRCLVHTAMPVTSVGHELGFADGAYFSRFFRRHTGQAPSEFAAQHRS